MVARGFDEVRFLVSANPGEEPRPLEKVASAGDLPHRSGAEDLRGGRRRAKSRLRRPVRTLVFDEVDAGIGGRALKCRPRLKLLSAASQVLCVTHLRRSRASPATITSSRSVKRVAVAWRSSASWMRRPHPRDRRMLSGEKVTEEALRHARS